MHIESTVTVYRRRIRNVVRIERGRGWREKCGITERMCDENQTVRDIYLTKVKQNKNKNFKYKIKCVKK